jgi:hypothetical protein
MVIVPKLPFDLSSLITTFSLAQEKRVYSPCLWRDFPEASHRLRIAIMRHSEDGRDVKGLTEILVYFREPVNMKTLHSRKINRIIGISCCLSRVGVSSMSNLLEVGLFCVYGAMMTRAPLTPVCSSGTESSHRFNCDANSDSEKG